VFQDAAHEVAREFAQAAVAVGVVEGGPFRRTQELVDVHAVAGLAVYRLGHERRVKVAPPREIADEELHPQVHVRRGDQREEADLDLALARRAHLVVVVADGEAGGFDGRGHLGPQVVISVQRRDGLVAALAGDVVAGRRDGRGDMRTFLLLGGVGEVQTSPRLGGVVDVAQEVELVLGRYPVTVGDAEVREVGLGALGEGARVAREALARVRLVYIAYERYRRPLPERLEHRRRRVGLENEVAGLDRFVPGVLRTVEADAALEQFTRKPRRRDRDVVPPPGEVDEFQIQVGDVVLAREGRERRQVRYPFYLHRWPS